MHRLAMPHEVFMHQNEAPQRRVDLEELNIGDEAIKRRIEA